MRRSLLLLALAGCTQAAAPVVDAGAPKVAAVVVDAGAPFVPTAQWAQATVAQSCQSCHSEMILDQQRLSLAQWTAVVKKMKGFGAAVEDAQLEPLAAQLAERRGPKAALPEVKRIDAKAAAELFAVQDDGPLAGGDAAQGKTLFEARCLACHGADARGGIGVNLVDRLMLQRAADFAAYVRAGRGLMPPQADLTDAQLGQLLAYVRTK